MDRTPSVLLLTDHALAEREARVSLGAAAAVRRGSLAHHRGAMVADVVVLEQTLSGPPSHVRLADLARRTAGTPILSVVADGTGRYRWLRVRAASGWFRFEASGTGTLAEAVSDATAPGDAIPATAPGDAIPATAPGDAIPTTAPGAAIPTTAPA